MLEPFYSIYSHGFIRAAVCVPFVRVADPEFNLERTLGLARRASELHAAVALFPELGLSAYSNEDLFHQDALLDATEACLARLIEESHDLVPVLLVGAPLRLEGKLFNCAVVIYRGRVLGIVPKSYLPNYREFYERRQFTPARDAVRREVSFLGTTVPFGNDLAKGEAVDRISDDDIPEATIMQFVDEMLDQLRIRADRRLPVKDREIRLDDDRKVGRVGAGLGASTRHHSPETGATKRFRQELALCT